MTQVKKSTGRRTRQVFPAEETPDGSKEIIGESAIRKFQVERLVFFSDAIFAIAITLLVIDLRLPDLDTTTLTDRLLWQHLAAHSSTFLGFAVSFYVIGTYWLIHHRMFYHVTDYNTSLLRNNLIFLLSIVLMPFSTTYITSFSNGVVKLPLLLYTINISFTGCMIFRLWQLISNPKHRLSGPLQRAMVTYNKVRALAIPVVFLLTFLLSFISIAAAYKLLPLGLLTGSAVKWYFRRKHAFLQG